MEEAVAGRDVEACDAFVSIPLVWGVDLRAGGEEDGYGQGQAGSRVSGIIDDEYAAGSWAGGIGVWGGYGFERYVG